MLRNRFESSDIAVGDGRRAGPGTFYLALLVALYDKGNGYSRLAVGLRRAMAGDASVLQILADTFLGRDGDGHYNSLQEAIGIIRCADAPSTYPPFPEFRATFDQFNRDYPILGPAIREHPDRVRPSSPAAECRRRPRWTSAPPA